MSNLEQTGYDSKIDENKQSDSVEDEIFEFDKPRFLLPEGCKDLNDAIRLQEEAAKAKRQPDQRPTKLHSASEEVTGDLMAKAPMGGPSQELPHSIALSDTVRVKDLAEKLCLKPYKIISALLKWKVFASADTDLGFDIASVVCAGFGVNVTRSGGT